MLICRFLRYDISLLVVFCNTCIVFLPISYMDYLYIFKGMGLVLNLFYFLNVNFANEKKNPRVYQKGHLPYCLFVLVACRDISQK